MSRPPAPETCPVCGEEVPKNALACPECGSDHRSGWKEGANVYDGLDLPDDSFDDDGEFATQQASRREGINPVWWITGVLLLLAFLTLYFYAAR